MRFHIHDDQPCYEENGKHYRPLLFPIEGLPLIKKVPLPKNVGDLLAVVTQMVKDWNALVDALCAAGQIRQE